MGSGNEQRATAQEEHLRTAFSQALDRPGSASQSPDRARSSRAERGAAFVDGLFRAHANDVYRMVASLLGAGASDADIQDLTQQVFLAAYRSHSRFRGECKPQTWLYGIASNTVLTYLRSRRRHKRLVEALELEPNQRFSANLEDNVAKRQELQHVWRCLMKINPKKRIVYVLYEVEGLSGKEIADALKINEATVRTRLHHARKELTEAWRKSEGKAPK